MGGKRTTLDFKLQNYVIEENGCWRYLGAINRNGYGVLKYQGKATNVHRAYYLERVGPISPSLVVDHLCKSRSCINPAHMELVTRAENTRRSTSPNVIAGLAGHCARGHPFTEENTVISKKRWRQCGTCIQEQAWRNLKGKRTICKRCGTDFEQPTISSRYCTKICADNAYNKRLI